MSPLLSRCCFFERISLLSISSALVNTIFGFRFSVLSIGANFDILFPLLSTLLLSLLLFRRFFCSICDILVDFFEFCGLNILSDLSTAGSLLLSVMINGAAAVYAEPLIVSRLFSSMSAENRVIMSLLLTSEPLASSFVLSPCRTFSLTSM